MIDLRILGVHDGHNASACLIEDGAITYCIQEERLTNQKNYAGFPEKSINCILKLQNLTIHDIDYFALASDHTSLDMGTFFLHIRSLSLSNHPS